MSVKRPKHVWTEEMDSYLIAVRSDKTIVELAQQLEVNVTYVQKRLKALGFDSQGVRWSEELDGELLALGVDGFTQKHAIRLISAKNRLRFLSQLIEEEQARIRRESELPEIMRKSALAAIELESLLYRAKR
jgi:hypothetical protein